ncbi:MAG: hypothetical protein EORIYHIE_001106 [Candidatus Fervidibacter sp.]|jgi:hypothetical protein
MGWRFENGLKSQGGEELCFLKRNFSSGWKSVGRF